MPDNSPAPNGADSVVVACAHCGQKNRVLKSHLGSEARCGKCKQAVFHQHPVVASDATWQREVEASPIPVLVDFWAPWCGPCRAIAPMVDAVASERTGRLKVVKLNIDENPQIAARFGIQAIPTMMIFRGPQVVDQIRGAVAKPSLDARLDRLQP